MICQQFLSILAVLLFHLIFVLKSASKSCFFFAVASRSGFGAAMSEFFARSSTVFCNSVCAVRIVMAASKLLGAMAACVILLSFAAGFRESWHQGCDSDLSADFCFGVKIGFWSCNF